MSCPLDISLDSKMTGMMPVAMIAMAAVEASSSRSSEAN